MAEVKRSSRVYFGVSDSTADETTKSVTIWNPVAAELGEGETTPQLDLEVGDYLITKFTNGNEVENFTLELAINDSDQNISVTANTGFPALIRSDVGEYYKWPAQELVGFVWVNGSMPAVQDTNETVPSETTITTGSEETTESSVESGSSEEVVEPTVNEDTTETAEPAETLESYYWKPFTFRVASEEVYGVTKLVRDLANLSEDDPLDDNDERPVSWKIILQKIKDYVGELNLTGAPGDGSSNNWYQITLDIPDKATINDPVVTLPKPTYDFNEIQSMGGAAHFWNSIENNYVNNPGLSIGRRYESDNQGNYTFIDNFTPYVLTGDTSSHNFIKIGRGELAAHQAGTRDASGNLVTITPYTRIFGDEVQLAMDNNSTGKVSIGTAHIEGTNDNYNALYTFSPTGALFEQGLTLNNLRIGDAESSVTLASYINTQIGKPIMYYGWVESSVLTYPAFGPNSSIPTSLGEGKDDYTLAHRDDKNSGNLYMWIADIDGYRPMVIRGWNVNTYPSGARSADEFYVWECFLEIQGGRPRVRFALKNTTAKERQCRFKTYVLYVKNSWHQQYTSKTGRSAGNLKST